MNITEITIENIKGFQNHCFKMVLCPNRPNILVAPNGFGKSSFAIAFESLHESRLMVEDKNIYLEDNTLVPKLEIKTSTGLCLRADNNANEINEHFETFVTNDQQQPKANTRRFMGRIFSKPTIDIKPTVLVQTVPDRVEFKYKLSDIKTIFGNNYKVLSDIKPVFSNGTVMSEIALINLATIAKDSEWQKELNGFVEDINRKKETASSLCDYINNNCVDIMGKGPFPSISEVLYKHEIVAKTDLARTFLYSWQIWQVYFYLGSDFKKACKYSKYLQDKEYYTHEIEEINPVRN